MRSVDDFLALHRFGLGPGPEDAVELGGDPRGWVLSQIAPEPELPTLYQGLRGSQPILKEIHEARQTGAQMLREVTRRGFREEFVKGILLRATLAINTQEPLRERMVDFWFNHFTVSNTKRILAPVIPAYEREVIRPHVFGRFSDMLRAAIRHPVMLAYLDNITSLGENSAVGTRRRQRSGQSKTLNENLGREILELHTLGVNGGYTQSDVIALSRAISGWTIGGIRPGRDTRPVHGGFEFRPAFHEPGPKTVLGKTYPNDGPQQGLDILDDLARHPSTAAFIAAKLVRHFVADSPPQAAVTAVADRFLATDGDLGETLRCLIELDVAWDSPGSKVKSHYDFVIAANRATGNRKPKRGHVILPLQELGQVPFTAPSPAGWGDRAADWIAPEALMRRIEWARRYAGTRKPKRPPQTLVDNLIGPIAQDATRVWVDRAPSPDAALALILASPEFQRR